MAKTDIMSCKCSNEYQDNAYGKGKRVHNMLKPNLAGKDQTQKWRCTVCGNIRS